MKRVLVRILGCNLGGFAKGFEKGSAKGLMLILAQTEVCTWAVGSEQTTSRSSSSILAEVRVQSLVRAYNLAAVNKQERHHEVLLL